MLIDLDPCRCCLESSHHAPLDAPLKREMSSQHISTKSSLCFSRPPKELRSMHFQSRKSHPGVYRSTGCAPEPSSQAPLNILPNTEVPFTTCRPHGCYTGPPTSDFVGRMSKSRSSRSVYVNQPEPMWLSTQVLPPGSVERASKCRTFNAI